MANGGGAFNGFPGGTFLPQPNVALDPELPLPQPDMHAIRDAEVRRAAESRRTRQGAADANGQGQEETQDQLGLHPSAHQLILALLGNMRGAQFPGQNVHPHIRALSDANPASQGGSHRSCKVGRAP